MLLQSRAVDSKPDNGINSIGDKVFEFRIDVGKGYRVYFMDRSSEIIILLVGGDKKTQSDNIKTAKRLANEYEHGETD